MFRFANSAHWLAIAVALLALALAAWALANVTVPDDVQAELPVDPAPIPTGAMWTLGTGGDGENPYVEWVAVYPTSALWEIHGAPSLRFIDHAPAVPGQIGRASCRE